MLVSGLRSGSWYLYKGNFIVEFLYTYKDRQRNAWWRFVLFNESPYSGFNLLDKEVHRNVEPVHPILDQYFSLFKC